MKIWRRRLFAASVLLLAAASASADGGETPTTTKLETTHAEAKQASENKPGKAPDTRGERRTSTGPRVSAGNNTEPSRPSQPVEDTAAIAQGAPAVAPQPTAASIPSQSCPAPAPAITLTDLSTLMRHEPREPGQTLNASLAIAAVVMALLALGLAAYTLLRLASLPRSAAAPTLSVNALDATMRRLNDQLTQFEGRFREPRALERVSRHEIRARSSPRALDTSASRLHDSGMQRELLHALLRALDAHGRRTSSGSHLEVELDCIARSAAVRGAPETLEERLANLNLIAADAQSRVLREQNFLSVVDVRSGSDNEPRRVVRVHQEAIAELRTRYGLSAST